MRPLSAHQSERRYRSSSWCMLRIIFFLIGCEPHLADAAGVQTFLDARNSACAYSAPRLDPSACHAVTEGS